MQNIKIRNQKFIKMQKYLSCIKQKIQKLKLNYRNSVII